MRRFAAQRLQQMTDVVAEREAVDDTPDEPGGGAIEDGRLFSPGVPGAVVELVDCLAGLAAEQPYDIEVFAAEQMHAEVGGIDRDTEGVVALRQAGQKPWRIDTGLAGESHQTSRFDAPSLYGDDEHRIVQRGRQPLECFHPRFRHRVSIPTVT